MLSLADSMNILVSTAYGKGDIEHARRIRRWEVKLVLSSAVIIYFLIFVFKPLLFKLSGVNPTKTVSSVYLSVISFFSINQKYISYFTAIGCNVISLVVSMPRNLILAIIFIIDISTFAGANEVWVGYRLAEATASFFIIINTFFIFERKNSIN